MEYKSRIWTRAECERHPAEELPCKKCIEAKDMNLYRPAIIDEAKTAFMEGFGYTIEDATVAEMEMLSAWRDSQVRDSVRHVAERRIYSSTNKLEKTPIGQSSQYDFGNLFPINPCGEIPLSAMQTMTEFAVDKVLDAKASWLLGKSEKYLLTDEERTQVDQWIEARKLEGSTMGCQDPLPDDVRIAEWRSSENPVQRAKAAYILGTSQPELTRDQTVSVDMWITRRIIAQCEIGQGDDGTEQVELSKIEPTANWTARFKSVMAAMQHGANYGAVGLEGQKNGTYKIVDGREKVAAARFLGWKTIKARIVGRRE